MRINININEDLLRKVDEAADNLSISRSAYISAAVSQKLSQEQALESIPQLMEAVHSLLTATSALAEKNG